MAKVTTLQINALDTNRNAIQKSLGNANPNAKGYVLKEFAQRLNSLTTNTISNVYRIDKEDITNAAEE